MAKTGNRAQRAGAKAAKRRQMVAEKKKLEQAGSGLAGRIAIAAEGPIELCVRMRNLFGTGMGHVIITRRLPTQTLSCAFFLVDTYCLGVKDVFHTELSPLDFEEQFESLQEADDFVPMDPASARKLLRDAAAFAARAEIRPAKDFAVLIKIFGDVDADESTEDFTFGKDGKPFLIAGPNDTPAKLRDIVAKLERHYRPGEWGYAMAPLPDDDEDLLFSDEDFLDEEDDPSLGNGLIIEHDPTPR